MKRTLQILSIASFLFLIVGCNIFTVKSGSTYNNQILKQLNEEYNEDFTIVKELGKNEDGYEVVVVSPNKNPELEFKSEFYNDGIEGLRGLPFAYTKGFFNSYEESNFILNSPPLYKKYLNIEIDGKKELKISNKSLELYPLYEHDNPYFINNVNDNNKKQVAELIVAVYDFLEDDNSVIFTYSFSKNNNNTISVIGYSNLYGISNHDDKINKIIEELNKEENAL